MNFSPSRNLTESQIQSGLKSVVADGLFAEAMVAFTSGTFLIAIALHMGASNVQLGLIAALPAFSNMFQLFSISLVRRYKNRKVIALINNFLSRFPLALIAALPFLFRSPFSIQALIFLLFFHYSFGAIAGATWNSWMKDLVPEKQLGSYFSHRGRLTQILNITLTLLTALILDYVKVHYPDMEIPVYSLMFAVGTILGMVGIYALSKVPEPKTHVINENLFTLLKLPLQNINFRKLLLFNSAWAFALNIATPFFTVYMMKTMGLSISYIIGLGLLGQLSGIFFIKLWGRYSDRYSNKTIINICAPVYILCIIGWVYTAVPDNKQAQLILLALISLFSGITSSGINLALNNIGIKLAPATEAIVYLTSKNIIVNSISAITTVTSGLLADFFFTHHFSWTINWGGADSSSLSVIHLQGWTFFFLIGGLLAIIALRLLRNVKENGEIHKTHVIMHMQTKVRQGLRAEARRSFNLHRSGYRIIHDKVRNLLYPA
jgi:MFS family permease